MAIDRAVLPIPETAAQQHSEALKEVLIADIGARGGWMSFVDMMGALLYTPGLGYYAAGSAKFGAAGDFVTAPEMSEAFGRTVAHAVAADWPRATPLEVLEPGGGSGALAIQMLKTWEALGYEIARYSLLETSPHLRQVQQEALSRAVPGFMDRVVWVDDVPDAFEGWVVANEVLDAMPVHLVVKGPQGWLERGVCVTERAQLTWEDRALSPALEASLAVRGLLDAEVPTGYVTEVGLPAEAWIKLLGERMRSGGVVLIDYGFPNRELYHPHRAQGTLMCHYRHFAHSDPFLYPGLQDITAHVDFTAVGQALVAGGFELRSYETQAHYLLRHGILDTMGAHEPGSVDWIRASSALQKLLSPAEMGELFKVITAHKKKDPTEHSRAVLELLGIHDG
jgi:SAM-dependent MidA family methyltransferase